MSRSSAARQGDAAVPVAKASARRTKRTRWPRRDRVGSEVAAPWAADRVAGEEALGDLGLLAEDREGDDLAAGVPGDAERSRHRVPPLANQRALVGRLVAADDLEDRVAVVAPRRLDRVVLDDRGEERLADEWLVDQVDHVRQRRPAGWAGSAFELVADLPPGRASVRAPADGVGRAEQCGDALADRVVDDQALAAELDERQCAQPLEGVRATGSTPPSKDSVTRRSTEVASSASRVSRRGRPTTARRAPARRSGARRPQVRPAAPARRRPRAAATADGRGRSG